MRRRGEGTFWIERRPGRPVRYVVEHVSNGQRQRQRFASEAEAVAALRRTNVDARPVATSSLSAYLDAWISDLALER